MITLNVSEVIALHVSTSTTTRRPIPTIPRLNGSGKTTTLKMILNIVSRDAGSVKVFERENDTAQNEDIGVVMDTSMYVEDWKIIDVEMALSPFYKRWDKTLFAEYIRRFGLDPNKKVEELSRGMNGGGL